MNAAQLTFGIEFETTMPANYPVGSYSRPIQAQGLPQGWKCKTDASIRSGARGRKGVEFVSPVLQGADGIRQVVAACKALNEMGAKVNASCGCHVHVGGFFRQFQGAELDKQLKKLVTLVSNFETAIYASTGTKQRERGTWCKGVKRHGNADNALTGYTGATADRYHVLNLTNVRRADKQTAEFRAFAATTNAVKAVGYIRMCLGLVERALTAKRTTNWDAKTPTASSPIARDGEGETALVRLFYQLGWTQGRTKKVYGDITHESAPTNKEIKKEFIRLTRKYDSTRSDRS